MKILARTLPFAIAAARLASATEPADTGYSAALLEAARMPALTQSLRRVGTTQKERENFLAAINRRLTETYFSKNDRIPRIEALFETARAAVARDVLSETARAKLAGARVKVGWVAGEAAPLPPHAAPVTGHGNAARVSRTESPPPEGITLLVGGSAPLIDSDPPALQRQMEDELRGRIE